MAQRLEETKCIGKQDGASGCWKRKRAVLALALCRDGRMDCLDWFGDGFDMEFARWTNNGCTVLARSTQYRCRYIRLGVSGSVFKGQLVFLCVLLHHILWYDMDILQNRSDIIITII